MNFKKGKWFKVATEGATADNRKIDRQWIQEMADNYDPKKYGARINLEHYHGIDPNGIFKRYGDVTALKTKEDSDGKLVLLAQIEPTQELIDMVKNKQKVYTSIEIQPDFADTGKAYLVGLAVTDNPASLGTEMLSFCMNAKENPLSYKKQSPDNSIVEAIEVEFSFDADEAGAPSILERVKAMFSKKHESDTQNIAAQNDAIELMAARIVELEEKLATQSDDYNGFVSKEEFKTLQEKLRVTPKGQFASKSIEHSVQGSQTDKTFF